MCGIVGIVASPGGALPDETIGRAMNDAIIHRGPDDEGIYRDDQAMLGMRRLSIIDLAGGHQPVHNEDGSVQAVCNGEIYNYRELRASWRRADTVSTRSSDTEVIVHGYEEWGDDASSASTACSESRSGTRARGADPGARPLRRKAALLPCTPARRDRKPASLRQRAEVAARVPGFKRDIDADAVRSYVCFGYVPAPGSIFRDVHKLPPAHYSASSTARSSCIATIASSSGPSTISTSTRPRKSWPASSTRRSRAGSSRTSVRRVPERRPRLQRRGGADGAPHAASRSARSRIGFREATTTSSPMRVALRASRNRAPRADRRARCGRAAGEAGLVSRRAFRRFFGGADLPGGEARAPARQDGAHRRRRRRSVRRL